MSQAISKPKNFLLPQGKGIGGHGDRFALLCSFAYRKPYWALLRFSFVLPKIAIIRQNLTILPSSMEQKLFEGAWFVDISIGQKRARWVGASSTQWRWKLGIRDFLLNFVSQAIFNPRKIILVHNKSTRVHGDNFVLPCNVTSRKP